MGLRIETRLYYTDIQSVKTALIEYLKYLIIIAAIN
jgi:hypothetical protein